MHTHRTSVFVSLLLLSCAAGCGSGDSNAAISDGFTPTAMSSSDGGVPQSGGGSDGGNNGSGGNGNTNGNGLSDGPPADAVGLATFPKYDTSSNDTFLDSVAGTYDVVIFRTPAENTSWLGKATLTIERKGTGFGATLKDASGAVVSSFDSNDAKNALLTPVVGQVFGFKADGVESFLNITVRKDGLIFGAAGGGSQVGFRNNVTAFGKSVPSLFRQLAGSYHGRSQALTCDQPAVDLTLSAEGTATLKGKYSLSCAEGMVTSTWDGNDDYVVPADNMQPGYDVYLDSLNGGGSQVGGGIRVSIDEWSASGHVRYAASTASGSAGAIESNLLVKEGAAPTQDQFTVDMLSSTMLDVVASGDTSTAPFNANLDNVKIDEKGNLSFAGQTFQFQLGSKVEGTSDQKTFRFQAIYMTFNLVFVELTFKTDKTFIGGIYGGIGQGGKLAPK